MMLVNRWNPNRRQVLGALTAMAAGAGNLFGIHHAIAEDNPTDCSPIGAAGKKPVPYKPNPALPVRMRKSAFELSATEVDRLKAAYSALRKLTTTQPDDPRGWLRQSYVHCWYCGGGSNGQSGQEIHGSWLFLPWHRAYLHFQERILCKLIGDETFALPYWDWDSQKRQVFPPIYGDPNDSSNPLFDMLRSAKPGPTISTQAVSVPILNRTMNTPTSNLFLGSQAGSTGAIENAPHNPTHIWTGDMTMKNANNDMGVLATAARDPVFFAHHANIDRLWSVWLGLSPQHQNFNANAWLQTAWQFYDENSVWTQITVKDVLDPVKSLRSSYVAPNEPPIWTFKPHAAPHVVAGLSAKQQQPLKPLILANATAEPIPLGTAPLTREVTTPAAHARAFSRLQAATPAQFVLHIRGIEVPSDSQAMFNVFVDLPNATATTSTDVPNFVGTVTVLAKTKEMQMHKHPPTNAAFDVTDILGEIKGDKQLSVTLVPVAGEGAAPASSQATFRQISLEQL
jgi:polyphenol oxidase